MVNGHTPLKQQNTYNVCCNCCMAYTVVLPISSESPFYSHCCLNMFGPKACIWLDRMNLNAQKRIPCAGTRWRGEHPKSTKMCCFGEKRSLNRKIQNFATKQFMRTPLHVFLPSFVEIRGAAVTKTWSPINAWCSSRKKISILPLSPGPLKRFRPKFNRSPFLTPVPSAKFHTNPSSFRDYIRENVV